MGAEGNIVPFVLTGSIQGQLHSAEPLEPTDGIDVQDATAHIFRQDAAVREQADNESIDDYLGFLDEAGRTLVDTLQVTPANLGSVNFNDLPLADDINTPLIYTLQISEAHSEVRDPDDAALTRTVHFAETAVPNLMAEADDPVTVQDIHLIPFDGFEVNSTGDAPDLDQNDGVCDTGELQSEGRPECTLRAAIQQANEREGRDLISFNIPGPPPHTIFPESKLPAIKDAVLIDGNTQPGFDPGDIQAFGGPAADPGSPPRLMQTRRAMSVGMQQGVPNDKKVIVDGSLAHLKKIYRVKAPNVNIRGKRIVNYEKAGITLTQEGSNAKITGNFIGVTQDGQPQEGNGVGIVVWSSGNTIGGITQVPGKAPGNVISGNKGNGIWIRGSEATGNQVLGNIIGLNPSGTNPLENMGNGILISGSPDNMIGGVSAGAGNVISGNHDFGVFIAGKDATGNTVAGNIIGLDKTGSETAGNGFSGVRIAGASGNMIGGTQAGAGNVISGNAFSGVSIANENTNDFGGVVIFEFAQETEGNMVVGNLIGFVKDGTTTRGNGSHGVSISSARGTMITANHIGGNNDQGVFIGGPLFSKKGARETILQRNHIGKSPTGSRFPNGANGVFVTNSAKKNVIGGIDPRDGNIIVTRDQSAVVIESGTKNRILANTLTMAGSPEAGTIAIDLGDDGTTLNDIDNIDGTKTDADTGPNKLQNFPAIFQAEVKGGDLKVTGALFSKPELEYTIQVFTCDGNPGRSFTFVGELSGVNIDIIKLFTFTQQNTQVQPGSFVAATATDSKGNTSEFSVPCVQVR